jgi:hypothetical protein
MVSLSTLQTELVQAPPAHLHRYRPCDRFSQQPTIPRKARVSIPTANQLQTQHQYKHLRNEPFCELPDETNTGEIDWKCSGLGSQPILELPKEICPLFEDSKELYTTHYQGNTGVWYAILFALDPEFITRTMGNQQKCIRELKQQMSIELDDYYQKYKYRQYGYKKSEMDRMLMHSDEYHTTLGHFLTDFMDINVLVLLESRRFHWVGRFDETRVTSVMYHKGVDWYAIVHPDQTSHLRDAACVESIIRKLTHVHSLDASQQHAHLVIDATLLNKLKKEIKNMKIKELQDRASELELHVCDANGKKKLKKDLQEEIFTQLTGCETF